MKKLEGQCWLSLCRKQTWCWEEMKEKSALTNKGTWSARLCFRASPVRPAEMPVSAQHAPWLAMTVTMYVSFQINANSKEFYHTRVSMMRTILVKIIIFTNQVVPRSSFELVTLSTSANKPTRISSWMPALPKLCQLVNLCSEFTFISTNYIQFWTSKLNVSTPMIWSAYFIHTN